MSAGRAQFLRRNQTEAERLLWSRLRGKQVDGARFRRQVPLGRYTADFCSFERRVVIELDGGQHAKQQVHDEIRTRWMEAEGFVVLRYWNRSVFEQLDDVLSEIFKVCVERRGIATLYPKR
ncbi:endonuclease domain-containing protein [Minwuia sp.]|uniref:endonuclease domain-containing protein n=1 Tax=Minwuia sp. TaxID=2493630 RepID=UPI003A8EA8E3